MRKSTRWLALVSITALIALSLLGGIVSAMAGSGAVYPLSEAEAMGEGAGGTAPEQPEPTTPEGDALSLLGGEPEAQGNSSPEGGRLCALAFLDENENGEMDAGEVGLDGVAIKLDGGEAKVSDADGKVCYDGLDEGSYTLSATDPEGYRPTTQTSYTHDISCEDAVTVYFGYARVKGLEGESGDAGESGDEGAAQPGASPCCDGVIEALVKVDENGNGVIDDADTLLDGVTVRLSHLNADGTQTPVSPASLITGPGCGIDVLFYFWWVEVCYPAGHAIWRGLERAWEGQDFAWYRLSIEVPGGYTLVEPASGEYLLPLRCSLPCWWYRKEFLLSKKSQPVRGSISGHKYNDADGSGDYSEGDLPLRGWTIELYDEAGNLLETTITNAAGEYSFGDLPEGLYTVKEVLESGWRYVSPDNGIIADIPVAGDAVTGKDFLNARYLSIRGHKYADNDCDGAIGEADSGLPGVEVELLKWDAASAAYASVASTVTGAQGAYEFTGLLPGTYKVREVLTAAQLEEWFMVSPAGGAHEGVVLTCEDAEGLDFLNARYGALEGWKYWDMNENGIMDEGDEGLPGVTIVLDPDPALGARRSTVTDENGRFFFDRLLPGGYTVWVDESTAIGLYAVGPTSLDVEIYCGRTTQVYFSEAPYCSISGIKWLDANYNGIRDADEKTVIEGITINLYEGNPPEKLIATTTTAADGSYAFLDLEAGEYTVSEEGGSGYFATTPESVAVSLSPGEGAVVDFGNCPYGRIDGLKFADLDGNGLREAGEPGLADVKITLERLGGAFTATTSSGEYGAFSFAELRPGIYTVSETVPAGYYATLPISVEVLVAPGDIASVIFANALYGEIGGTKYMDDGDELLDADKDRPLEGLTVTLTGVTLGGEHVSMETKTLVDGSYAFLLLEAGEYTVAEVYDTEKMQPVFEDSVQVVLSPKQQALVDFLNVEIEIGGEVVKPEPEPPASSVTLPHTGMEQLPLIITATALVLLGLAFLAFGLRRRYQE